MCVWGLPLFAFAAIATTVVLVVVVGGLLALRARVRTSVVRGLLSGAAVVALLAGPAIAGAILERPLANEARRGMYIHPPRYLYWAPSLVAPCILAFAYACRKLYRPRRLS